MPVRGSLVAAVLLTTLSVGSAAGADGTSSPFVLSAATASVGETVELSVQAGAKLPRKALRVYLVSRREMASVRSRFDPRLYLIGEVAPTRPARLTFTVAPLDAGSYALAYWCRRCSPEGHVAVQQKPAFHIAPSAGDGCAHTTPNGIAPRGVPRGTWRLHGSPELAVLLPPSGVLTTNSLGGLKMLWVARHGLAGSFRVSYRDLDAPSEWFRADTVTGTLGGYDGPAWASRMSFEPACWQVLARVADVGLAFVAEVASRTR